MVSAYLFCYQSGRHCSKTCAASAAVSRRFVTSQDDTAPKRSALGCPSRLGVVTSQDDTAPKPL